MCRQKRSADVRPGEVSQKQEMALPLLPCQGSGLGQAAPLSRVLGSGFGLRGSPRSACVELGGSAQGAFSDISVWGLFSKMACQLTCKGGKPHAPTCRCKEGLWPGSVLGSGPRSSVAASPCTAWDIQAPRAGQLSLQAQISWVSTRGAGLPSVTPTFPSVLKSLGRAKMDPDGFHRGRDLL